MFGPQKKNRRKQDRAPVAPACPSTGARWRCLWQRCCGLCGGCSGYLDPRSAIESVSVSGRFQRVAPIDVERVREATVCAVPGC